MKKYVVAACSWLLVCSWPAVSLAEAANALWVLSQKDSILEVRTGTEGILGGLAHEHTIGAESFEGRIEFDPASPLETRIDVTLKSDSLRVLDRDVDEDIRQQIESNMRELIQPEAHPTMRFVSKAVVVVEDGLQVDGVMTIVGKDKAVKASVVMTKNELGYVATTAFVLNHTDFGIEPYSAALGTIRVSDALKFKIEAQLIRP